MELKKAAAIAGVATLGYLGYALVTAQTPKISRAEGVCSCGTECVCECGCAESGVCNCGPSCPCDCGCGWRKPHPSVFPSDAESFAAEVRRVKIWRCEGCQQLYYLKDDAVGCCYDKKAESFSAEGHEDECGGTACPECGLCDCQGDSNPCCESFSAELKKDSCCCGATKSKPCACMIEGVIDCSPTCPCFVASALKATREATENTKDPYEEYMELGEERIGRTGEAWDEIADRFFEKYGWKKPHYGYDTDRETNTLWVDTSGEEKERWEDTGIPAKKGEWLLTDMWDEAEWMGYQEWCKYEGKGEWDNEAESSSAEYVATRCDSCEAIYPQKMEGHECECKGTIRNLYEYDDGSADFDAESTDAEMGHPRWVVGEGYSGRAKCKVCGEVIPKGQPTIDYHSTRGIMSIHSRPEHCGVKRAESFSAESDFQPPICAWCKKPSAKLREVDYGGGGAVCPDCHWAYRKLGYNPHKPAHPFKQKGAESLKKDSCCCGATKSKPCACMIQGVIDCNATCPCSLEKKAESFSAEHYGNIYSCPGKKRWTSRGRRMCDGKVLQTLNPRYVCDTCDEDFSRSQLGSPIYHVNDFHAESFSASSMHNMDPKEIETLYSYIEYLEDKCGNHYEAFIDAGLDPYRTNAESFGADVKMDDREQWVNSISWRGPLETKLEDGFYYPHCDYCGDSTGDHDMPIYTANNQGYFCINCLQEWGLENAESFSAEAVRSSRWECSKCGADFDDEEEAEECCPCRHKNWEWTDVGSDLSYAEVECLDCDGRAMWSLHFNESAGWEAEEIWVKNAEGNLLGPLSEAEWSYLKYETEDNWAGEAITEMALWDEEDDGADEDAIAHYTANFNNENLFAEYMAEPRKGGTSRFMDPKQVIDLFKKANGTLVSVTFVKRTNGEIRKMLARTSVRKGVKGVGLKFKPSDKNLMGVYDFGEVRKGADPWKCYRFVPVDAVLSLRVRGKTYTA